MDFINSLTHYGPYLASFIICFASGIIPLVNAELYILTFATFFTAPANIGLVALACALGQMTSKAIIYFAGYGALKIPAVQKARGPKVDKILSKLQKSKWETQSVIFASSFLGFPPLYILSIACGIVRTAFWSFMGIGIAGRFLRFFLIGAFPELVMNWFKK